MSATRWPDRHYGNFILVIVIAFAITGCGNAQSIPASEIETRFENDLSSDVGDGPWSVECAHQGGEEYECSVSDEDDGALSGEADVRCRATSSRPRWAMTEHVGGRLLRTTTTMLWWASRSLLASVRASSPSGFDSTRRMGTAELPRASLTPLGYRRGVSQLGVQDAPVLAVEWESGRSATVRVHDPQFGPGLLLVRGPAATIRILRPSGDQATALSVE